MEPSTARVANGYLTTNFTGDTHNVFALSFVILHCSSCLTTRSSSDWVEKKWRCSTQVHYQKSLQAHLPFSLHKFVKQPLVIVNPSLNVLFITKERLTHSPCYKYGSFSPLLEVAFCLWQKCFTFACVATKGWKGQVNQNFTALVNSSAFVELFFL